MKILRAASVSSQGGDPKTFTGEVVRATLGGDTAGTPVNVYRVEFTPGARTHWHTHPLGQTLHVIVGVGRVQSWGGPIREIRPGDTVWIAPGEKHWHGASPETAMEHIAMQEQQGGEHVKWFEPVTDAQYLGK